ncbi:hypothetical protein K461DRAFT_272622 [Myriangium duriaei CBS 260.36]|uniref:DUF1308 domain-containing protein n=1 Tax=Myriangium duriaei CBS 260.36 TaxID=1168546 RepID=A0A9P4JAS8_9PEZI|nr:hypothetical protein K461DRAFT_272622 [Myriangium duriaei CBS 260.36]
MSLPLRVNGSSEDASTRAPTTNGTAQTTPTVTSPLQPSRSADELLVRCRALRDDIEAFRDHLKTQRKEHTVEMSHYRGVVKSELKNLERLAQRQKEARELKQAEAVETIQEGGEVDSDQSEAELDSEDEPVGQSVASSNLPFLESVWNATKSTTGLVAMQKRFYFGEDVKKQTVAGASRIRRGRGGTRSSTVKAGKALVDIVARDGMEWIKVSLITNHRMLMDKAREGWSAYSSDEDDGSDGASVDSDDPDSNIPVVKMSEALLEASMEVRIRTKHPQVRLLLPKVVEGRQPEVDKILHRLRSKGISVECDGSTVAGYPLNRVIDNLVPDPFLDFTTTLNIDCTILLALVSDFSHTDVEAEPWFHKALKRQVEIEDKENLLPNLLYPAIKGRKLLCTHEAAKRMREIVDTIGTPGEKARTEILMSDSTENDAESRRIQLKEWTKFEVPTNLELPVQVVDKDSVAADGLPPVASRVRQSLTAINQSVFMYGWSAGITTITSNRTVTKQLDTILDEHAESESDWPKIWLCPTARSLVGKEKGRE